MSMLLVLALVSAPVPVPKLNGIQGYQLVGGYYDNSAPEAYAHYRVVLSSGGSYWSHWGGLEYVGTWKYDQSLNCVVISERPVSNPAQPLTLWLLGAKRQGGKIRVGDLARIR